MTSMIGRRAPFDRMLVAQRAAASLARDAAAAHVFQSRHLGL